jgi:hypothetical protein
MIRHVVLLKWRKELTPAEMAEVQSSLDKLAVEAPPVRAMAHGPTLGIADSGADYALTVDVDDAAGWRAYSEHPSHALAREVLRRLAAEARTTQFALPDTGSAAESKQEKVG